MKKILKGFVLLFGVIFLFLLVIGFAFKSWAERSSRNREAKEIKPKTFTRSFGY